MRNKPAEPRKFPGVRLAPCPPEYALLLAQGWDSIQEAYAFVPKPEFVELLDRAQAAAREADEFDGIVVVPIEGRPFKVRSFGAKRYKWRFENDDFIVLVASSKKMKWAVSVRYLSAGLHEHGWDLLRQRVLDVLRPNTIQVERDCVRVSRADYFFDFYSPRLTAELQQPEPRHFVLHSKVKRTISVRSALANEIRR
jgi:hypothetical protein